MKKFFLLLLLISAYAADAQSLKEALYGGKLKSEPGTVIRKGDDLSAKMDTATKKQPENNATVLAVIPAADTTVQRKNFQAHTAVVPVTPITQDSVAIAGTATAAGTTTTTTTTTTTPPAEETAPPAPKVETAADITRDNNAQVKEYMNSIISSLKAEVLSNKKVKKESYFVMVSYAIDTDGQMGITDVYVSPENAFLLQQVRDRLAVETPKLRPVPTSNGTFRKVNKKYNFTITKE